MRLPPRPDYVVDRYEDLEAERRARELLVRGAVILGLAAAAGAVVALLEVLS